MNKLLLSGLACTAVLLTGCGGATPSPTASSAATSAAAPASSDATTPSPESSPSSAAAELKDPCSVLSPSAVAKATGVKIIKGKPSEAGGTKLCIWSTTETTSESTVNFTGQEGPSQGASLSAAEDALKKQYGGTITTIPVKGADEARYITGKIGKVPVVDVIAIRGEIYYQVLAASPAGADKYKDGVTAVVEALIAG